MGTAIIPAPNLNVKKTDIVNNLTSTNTDKPLSAAQGKALKDLIAQSTAITQGDGTFTSDIVSPGRLKWAKYGRVVFVTGEFTPIKVENQNIIATGLPKPIFYIQFGGPTRSMLINADGELQYWFSSDKSLIRDDIAVTYISST